MPSTSQTSMESNLTEVETQEDVEPASEAQIREMDSIVSAMEADVPLNHGKYLMMKYIWYETINLF